MRYLIFFIAGCLCSCAAFVFLYAYRRRIIERLSLLRRRHKLLRLPKQNLAQKGTWARNPRNMLWAHAGGANGTGVFFTNSKEAIEYSIEKKFNVIEIDVAQTSDGIFVLSHHFDPIGVRHFDVKPFCSEFLSTLIADKFSPLTLKMCFERFFDWGGYFSIDPKGANPIELAKYLIQNFPQSWLDRIIFQIETIEDLVAVSRLGRIGALHFCLSERMICGKEAELLPFMMPVLKSYGVASVSFWDYRITDKIKRIVAQLDSYGFIVSIAGVNIKSRLESWRSIGAKCFNTDYLLPNEVSVSA